LKVLQSLEYAFEMAIEEKTELVIFSGDAYKTCNPSATHQREFAKYSENIESNAANLEDS